VDKYVGSKQVGEVSIWLGRSFVNKRDIAYFLNGGAANKLIELLEHCRFILSCTDAEFYFDQLVIIDGTFEFFDHRLAKTIIGDSNHWL